MRCLSHNKPPKQAHGKIMGFVHHACLSELFLKSIENKGSLFTMSCFIAKELLYCSALFDILYMPGIDFNVMFAPVEFVLVYCWGL